MKSIMLVEDSEMFYNLLRRTIKNAELLWARSGNEAIEKYESQKPNLVLLDLILPDMSGIDVIEEIKKKDPGAKIIVLSGIDHDEVVRDAMDAGATDYISKSAGLRFLLRRIDEEMRD